MTSQLNRRNFLKQSMYASLAAGASLSVPARVLADCHLATPDAWAMPRTLVNIMMYGGMDSRFIFMPDPNHDIDVSDTDYLNKIWLARAGLYDSAYTTYQEIFDNEYIAITDPDSGFKFGIYNRCGWLASQYLEGNVAVVANSFCSKNRRHDQSQLNANAGDPAFNLLYYDRDGWGGRLVEQLGGANTIELSHEISLFGSGTTAGQRLEQVIHAQNTRDIALPNVNSNRNVVDTRNVMTRALKAYYEARSAEVTSEQPAEWPYHLFYQHNAAFRQFGDAVQCRLDYTGALPGSLANLNLYQNRFEQQCKNLYDVCLAPDILDSRVISMRYDGWDTHNVQDARIGNNLEDLFGTAGGLATTMAAIGAIPDDPLLPTIGPPAVDQLVYVTTSDFGRQIRANGDFGTDHGRGIYTILIGKDVNGGLYGEMFPERESSPDGNGRIPLETSGADIEGRTSTEQVLARACEWMQAGSSTNVFPAVDAGSAEIETLGMLDSLFSA